MTTVIQAEKLSKRYRIGEHERYHALRDVLTRALRSPMSFLRRSQPEMFWALKEVSLDVREGEVLGVIGRNGAGKTTLLKILSRITRPTSGWAEIRGRVGSLLEVGTGFHPELTGRENTFLSGAILGMSKREITCKFDEIVAFAEIEKFLDTPVKYYSSGMYVRLAFAVAAHLNPEILVVDEVLAVGDMAFQKKCIGKMSDVSRGGRTVLFVSHNLAAVQNLCHRGVVLTHGQLSFNGTAKEAIDFYLHSVSGQGSHGHVIDLANAPRTDLRRPRLLEKMEFYMDGSTPMNGNLPMGAPLKIRLHFPLSKPTGNFEIGIGFDNMFNQRVFTAHSCFEPDRSHGERLGPQV